MPAPTMAKSNSCMDRTLRGRRRACNSRAAMNIAHLLLGSAQEFRDCTALARGDARPSQLSRPVAQGFGHEHPSRGALRPVARRPRGLRHDQRRRVDRGDVRDLACRALRGADERQAACQGVRLHPGEFRRQALLRDARPRPTIAEAAREAPEMKEIVDVTTRAYSFMAVGDPSPIADSEPTDRRGCSTPRARPAGPRARSSDIETCWPWRWTTLPTSTVRRPADRWSMLCRSARFGPVEFPDGGARRRTGFSRERQIQGAGNDRADKSLARLQHLPGADHGEAADRAWQRRASSGGARG